MVHNLAIVNLVSVVININAKYFCDMLSWSLQGKYPGMVSLDHMEDVFLVS